MKDEQDARTVKDVLEGIETQMKERKGSRFVGTGADQRVVQQVAAGGPVPEELTGTHHRTVAPPYARDAANRELYLLERSKRFEDRKGGE